MSTRRILILMSDTGAGHRASAVALCAGFQQRFGRNVTVDCIDLLSDCLPAPLKSMPGLYPFLTRRAPWLWRALWHMDLRVTDAIFRTVAQLVGNAVARLLVRYDPHLIVSVHPLVQEMALLALNRLGQTTPFVTVVTDLASPHPLWFHPATARCYIAEEAAARRARARGLHPAQLRVFGLPIRAEFLAHPADPVIQRHALRLPPELPAVLIMGGGDGVGPLAKIAQATAQALSCDGAPQGQMIVVCGRNASLLARLQAMNWPVPVRILGYVEEMAAWMRACDCLITKAGPGTIAEALACGLPIILSGYIPGQEAGNVAFVVNHGVGRYLTHPQAIGAQVAAWLGSAQAEHAAISIRAARLAQRDATRRIVEDMAELLA